MAEFMVCSVCKMTQAAWLSRSVKSYPHRPANFGGKITKWIPRQSNHIHAGTFYDRLIITN